MENQEVNELELTQEKLESKIESSWYRAGGNLSKLLFSFSFHFVMAKLRTGQKQ
jgi:hypothetical protein